MKTRCNRCHAENCDRPAGEECGTTDAWGGNPCRGILLVPKRPHHKRVVHKVIGHLIALQTRHVNDANKMKFIELHNDIEDMKRMEAQL